MRCQSEGINKCTYPERKSASPAKRKASSVFKETRKDSLSPKAGKELGGEKWNRAETESVSSVALESPIHALASVSESEHEDTFTSTVEEQDQAMCKFSFLFEESPNLSMDSSEMLLLEASDGFSLESDTSDSVASLSTFPSHPHPTYIVNIQQYPRTTSPVPPPPTTSKHTYPPSHPPSSHAQPTPSPISTPPRNPNPNPGTPFPFHFPLPHTHQPLLAAAHASPPPSQPSTPHPR